MTDADIDRILFAVFSVADSSDLWGLARKEKDTFRDAVRRALAPRPVRYDASGLVDLNREWQFKECATCAAKPGSPTLCAGCLHNRTTIDRYNARQSQDATAERKALSHLRDLVSAIKICKAEVSRKALLDEISEAINTEQERIDHPRRP